MDDLKAFVAAILAGDLDAAGPFADWLDDRGDPRGVLLRRRWKRWIKDRAGPLEREAVVRKTLEAPLRSIGAMVGAMRAAGAEVTYEGSLYYTDSERVRIDAVFITYVRTRFTAEKVAMPGPLKDTGKLFRSL